MTTEISSPSIFVRRGNVIVGIVRVGTNMIQPIPIDDQEETEKLKTSFPELPIYIKFPYIDKICALNGMGASVLKIAEHMILKMFYHIPNLYISLSPMYDELNKVKKIYLKNGYDTETLDHTAIKRITPDVALTINTFIVDNDITCETPEAFYKAINLHEGGAIKWRLTRKYIRMHNGSRKQVYINARTQEAIKVGHKYVIFNIKL